MHTRSFEKLAHYLKPGHVYWRDDLLPYTKVVDRNLIKLVQEDIVEKVAAGLYHKPKASRFGDLPPDDKALVKAFLRDDRFLLVS